MNIGTNHPGLGLRGRKILIVTEDRSKVLSLGVILASEGYQFNDVASGAAALECFSAYDPDLVLLDVDQRGLKVIEICQALRKGHHGVGVPIILIASQSNPEEAVAGLAAGGVDYLSRPYRRQEMLARIRVHLLNRLRLAQLNREDKAKNRLLSTAAHDLRNPLVSIRALTNLLRTDTVGRVTAEQRDLLDTVYDASQSMLDLVNELLDVSVLDAGEMKLALTAASLAELVTVSVKLNNTSAAEKGSTIVWRPGPLPEQLVLDKPRIRQVLNNLLGNAIKFSPRGSTITVESELNATHCSLVVRDQGAGIPESERARLFKDFSRTSVRPTGGEPSTGLGLSICYRIMQAHAGSIQADNLPGGGAAFRITFPLPT